MQHSGAGGHQNIYDDDDDIIVGQEVDPYGDDEEMDVVDDGSRCDAETNKFDMTVGALEDILMDPEFEVMREGFCRQNCSIFEDTEENKLAYTDVFQQYTQLVESNIERRLKAAVPNFDMLAFLTVLDQRKDELMSDVFDLLLSMGDFDTFKDVMLSYKRELMNGGSGGAGGGLGLLTCRGMRVYMEEQEDGEARPDLDFGLLVTSPKPKGAAKPAVGGPLARGR